MNYVAVTLDHEDCCNKLKQKNSAIRSVSSHMETFDLNKTPTKEIFTQGNI